MCLVIGGAVVPTAGFFTLNYWMTTVKDNLGWEEGFGCVVWLLLMVLTIVCELAGLALACMSWSAPLGRVSAIIGLALIGVVLSTIVWARVTGNLY